MTIPFIVFALLFSLPSSRNSDPGSHSRLFSPPTHYGSCLAFLSREDFSSFFPRRLASNWLLTHARRSQQLILFSFLQINSKSRHGGDSNSRTDTSSIRGLPLVHRGDYPEIAGLIACTAVKTTESDCIIVPRKTWNGYLMLVLLKTRYQVYST